MTVTVITMPELGWDCVIDVVAAGEREAITQFAHEMKEDFDHDVKLGYRDTDEEWNENLALEQYQFFQYEV